MIVMEKRVEKGNELVVVEVVRVWLVVDIAMKKWDVLVFKLEIEADTVKDVFRGADVLIVVDVGVVEVNVLIIEKAVIIVDVVNKVEEVDGLEVVMEGEVVKEVDEVVEVGGVVGVVIE